MIRCYDICTIVLNNFRRYCFSLIKTKLFLSTISSVMPDKYSVILRSAMVLLLAAMLGGCPSSSSRVTVEGYRADMLVRKRIMVVTPDAADVTLSDPAAFASARGTVGEGAREQVAVDFRTRIMPAIASRLDSNTALLYNEQAVSGVVAINPTADFDGAKPKSWDAIKRASREGNIDFFIVLNGISFTTTSAGTASGTEAMVASYSLLDPKAGTVMTSGQVSVPAQAANPAALYDKFAEELVNRLPFHVKATAR